MVESSGAQRRRAVASVIGNNESPAYSHGGDQSAGFNGCGIQRVTRQSGSPITNASGKIPAPKIDVKRFGEKFAFLFRCQTAGLTVDGAKAAVQRRKGA